MKTINDRCVDYVVEDVLIPLNEACVDFMPADEFMDNQQTLWTPVFASTGAVARDLSRFMSEQE
jgi:hypothetical protein